MADQKAVQAALRRQIEADERRDEQNEQWAAERGLLPLTPERKRERDAITELMKKRPGYVDLNEMWEKSIKGKYHIEGFLVGWLAATGQLADYAELLEIWLSTPKSIDAPDPVDVTGLLDRVARSPRGHHE